MEIQNKGFSLSDLVPQESEIELVVNKEKKTFKLRPFSLADRVWVNRKYGEEVQEIFNQLKMVEIATICYHQLYDADKKFFKAQDVEFYDDEGECEVKRLTGPEVLMACIHGGVPGEIKLVQALLTCIGVSQPLLDKMEEAEIKKQDTKKKVSPKKKRTGRKSSTR